MITTATLSSKNQITIPKAILNHFDIKSGEKILVETDEDVIKLRPIGKSIVDQLAGSVKIPKSKKGIPYEKILEETKRIVARKLAAQ